MVENYKELIASVSANTAKLRKGIPNVMQGFNAMAGAAGKDGVLDAKTKELGPVNTNREDHPRRAQS